MFLKRRAYLVHRSAQIIAFPVIERFICRLCSQTNNFRESSKLSEQSAAHAFLLPRPIEIVATFQIFVWETISLLSSPMVITTPVGRVNYFRHVLRALRALRQCDLFVFACHVDGMDMGLDDAGGGANIESSSSGLAILGSGM